MLKKKSNTRGRKGIRKGQLRGSVPVSPIPDALAQLSDGTFAVFECKHPGDSVGMRYDSFLQAVALVMSGLPVTAVTRFQETSGLTLDRIKQVAGISEGSFARRKRAGRLSREESERLLRISRLFERATALYDGDVVGARRWLETPIPSLGDRRPLDLASTEPGAREVEDLIGRIEHGVLS